MASLIIFGASIYLLLRPDSKPLETQVLTMEEQAIQNAQDYFVGSVEQVDPSERFILAYLQRKFNLNPKIGVEGPPIDLHEDPQTYPEEKHYLARIAYPNKLVTVAPKLEPEDKIQLINIYSANCDHLPLPSNFWSTLEQSFQEGSYYMTHVALAFAFMKDNNCPLPPEADNLKTRTIQEMVKLADDPTTTADLRYEAVAFLMLNKQRDLVQPWWINQIVAEQRKSGGWSKDVGGDKDDLHTTILGLWSLLEYYRPNTLDEPMIRRPSITQ